MNILDATRYNNQNQGVTWTSKGLTARLQQILGARDAHNPLGDLPRLFSTTPPGVNLLDHLFAQEVELFQMLHGLNPDGKLGTRTFAVMSGETASPQSGCPIRGKGLWIWNEGHLPRNHVAMAREAGVGHVLVKIADHAAAFPPSLKKSEAVERLDRLITNYRAAGIEAHPWVYAGCYEDDDKAGTQILKQAKLHVELSRRLGAVMLVVNAEKGFKRYYLDGDGERHDFPYYKDHAKRYIEAVRGAGTQLALSTYFYVTGHGNFAWEELAGGVDILMPQVYVSLKSRAKNDAHFAIYDSLRDWTKRLGIIALGKPICPSGALYQTKGAKGWPAWHTPECTKLFIKTLAEHEVSGSTFWWYKEPSDEDGKVGASRITPDRWTAFAEAQDFLGVQPA